MGMQACLIAMVYSQRLGSAGLLNTVRAFAVIATPLAYFSARYDNWSVK
jgi:hypothetical protein